jgi:ankyrin repeat protein
VNAGNWTLVLSLLRSGADVNQSNGKGVTPLETAVALERRRGARRVREIVSLLFEAGAR